MTEEKQKTAPEGVSQGGTSEKVDEYAEKNPQTESEEEVVETPKDEPKEKVVEEPQKGRYQNRGRPVRKTREEEAAESLAAWEPKTKLGKEVRTGKIKDIDEILDSGRKILESEIVDILLKVQTDLISIGQSKGKFGGGKRRAWRQTQRKTKEGNVASFSTMAVTGDEKGHVGIGSGRAKETLPARDKATRKAKLNIMRIKRTCAGFDCDCSELHTIPFKVTGKQGSVEVTLIPAPQGTGLVVAGELKKILKFAGIKDVYSRTSGKQRTTFNLAKACMNALEKTSEGGKK